MTEQQAKQLDTIEKMVKDALFRLERIERYMERNFLATNYHHMEQAALHAVAKLKTHPGDINAMSTLTKIENDQSIIGEPMTDLNNAIWRDIVAKYGNGRMLKYFEIVVKLKSTVNVWGK